MPYFTQSANTNVHGSTLIDVQGSQYNVQVQAQFFTDEKTSELGIDALHQATVVEAFHNSRERAPPPKCHPETRRIILSEIISWIETTNDDISQNLKRVLWLHGPAGAGKSAIAQTISEFCAEAKTLAASFFFARGKDRRGTATHVFTTIAHQLATSNPQLRLTIGRAVAKNRAILDQCLGDQVRELIVDPLKSVQSAPITTGPYRRPFLIVIDSLDECHNDMDHCMILEHVAALIYTHGLPLTFLISSRPEPHIRHSFKADPALSTISHHVALESSPDDIRIFLRSGFHKIRQQYYLYTTALIPEDWPSEEDIETLVRRSSGYFIYPATALQFVNSVDAWPPDQLNLVLSGQSSPFIELDQLYHQILSLVPNSKLLVRILGYILLLTDDSQDEMDYHSPAVIGSLLGVRTSDIRLTLRKMHPLLDVPATDEPNIHIIHASFPDFLFNRDRAGKFHVDSKQFRMHIAHSCLKFMRSWTAPGTDQYAVRFVFRNWVRYCREAVQLEDRVLIFDDLEEVPDFLPDSLGAQYDSRYKETKLREAVEWLSEVHNTPRNFIHLINRQRDLCYLICLANYGSYHYLERVLTLPISVVFNPEEYLHERQQLSEELDADTLKDFYHASGGVYCVWKSFRTEEYVNIDKELFKFLLDKTRSREYFLGPNFFSTAHAKMLRFCIQTIVQSLDSKDQMYDFEVPPIYAMKYWSKHLSHCTPNNLELLSYIGPDLFAENASLGSASQVIQWLRSFISPPLDLLAWWEDCYRSLAVQRDNCRELLEPQIWDSLHVDSMTTGDWKTLAARIEALYLDGGYVSDTEVDVDSGTESESEVSSYLSNTESMSE